MNRSKATTAFIVLALSIMACSGSTGSRGTKKGGTGSGGAPVLIVGNQSSNTLSSFRVDVFGGTLGAGPTSPRTDPTNPRQPIAFASSATSSDDALYTAYGATPSIVPNTLKRGNGDLGVDPLLIPQNTAAPNVDLIIISGFLISVQGGRHQVFKIDSATGALTPQLSTAIAPNDSPTAAITINGQIIDGTIGSSTAANPAVKAYNLDSQVGQVSEALDGNNAPIVLTIGPAGGKILQMVNLDTNRFAVLVSNGGGGVIHDLTFTAGTFTLNGTVNVGGASPVGISAMSSGGFVCVALNNGTVSVFASAAGQIQTGVAALATIIPSQIMLGVQASPVTANNAGGIASVARAFQSGAQVTDFIYTTHNNPNNPNSSGEVSILSFAPSAAANARLTQVSASSSRFSIQTGGRSPGRAQVIR